MHWEGTGIWQGWKLTVEHSASSYNQPVLITPDGVAACPGDIIIGPLVGLSDAAEILGWDRRRVQTYVSRGAFPEPIQRLSNGPVWTRKQIEDYRDARK